MTGSLVGKGDKSTTNTGKVIYIVDVPESESSPSTSYSSVISSSLLANPQVQQLIIHNEADLDWLVDDSLKEKIQRYREALHRPISLTKEVYHEFTEAFEKQCNNKALASTIYNTQKLEFEQRWIRERCVEQLVEEFRQLINPSLQAGIQELVNKFRQKALVGKFQLRMPAIWQLFLANSKRDNETTWIIYQELLPYLEKQTESNVQRLVKLLCQELNDSMQGKSAEGVPTVNVEESQSAIEVDTDLPEYRIQRLIEEIQIELAKPHIDVASIQALSQQLISRKIPKDGLQQLAIRFHRELDERMQEVDKFLADGGKNFEKVKQQTRQFVGQFQKALKNFMDSESMEMLGKLENAKHWLENFQKKLRETKQQLTQNNDTEQLVEKLSQQLNKSMAIAVVQWLEKWKKKLRDNDTRQFVKRLEQQLSESAVIKEEVENLQKLIAGSTQNVSSIGQKLAELEEKLEELVGNQSEPEVQSDYFELHNEVVKSSILQVIKGFQQQLEKCEKGITQKDAKELAEEFEKKLSKKASQAEQAISQAEHKAFLDKLVDNDESQLVKKYHNFLNELLMGEEARGLVSAYQAYMGKLLDETSWGETRQRYWAQLVYAFQVYVKQQRGQSSNQKNEANNFLQKIKEAVEKEKDDLDKLSWLAHKDKIVFSGGVVPPATGRLIIIISQKPDFLQRAQLAAQQRNDLLVIAVPPGITEAEYKKYLEAATAIGVLSDTIAAVNGLWSLQSDITKKRLKQSLTELQEILVEELNAKKQPENIKKIAQAAKKMVDEKDVGPLLECAPTMSTKVLRIVGKLLIATLLPVIVVGIATACLLPPLGALGAAVLSAAALVTLKSHLTLMITVGSVGLLAGGLGATRFFNKSNLEQAVVKVAAVPVVNIDPKSETPLKKAT